MAKRSRNRDCSPTDTKTLSSCEFEKKLLLGTNALFLFLLATVSLNLSPGPDMLYVISRSLGQGRKAGIISALGIGAGTLVHTSIGIWPCSNSRIITNRLPAHQICWRSLPRFLGLADAAQQEHEFWEFISFKERGGSMGYISPRCRN